MFNKLAGIGLRGKQAAEHDEEEAKAEHDEDEAKAEHDEDEARASDDNDEQPLAEDDEEEAKAEDDEDEAKAAEDDEDKEAKAVAKAEKSARINARAIDHLCKLAKKPELAGEFIASGKSQAAVRRELLADRAGNSNEIAGHTGPSGSPAAAAALWDHANEKNSRFFGRT